METDCNQDRICRNVNSAEEKGTKFCLRRLLIVRRAMERAFTNFENKKKTVSAIEKVFTRFENKKNSLFAMP